ncbi:hypothetical protein HMPREF3229_01823 [Peptoniphilus harei]|uniref:Uncharacterized protein n=1 Tax=Peptoniphilus harei TaxID=54005 RepID=A0A133PGQ7_9FIRM|nr:hypothetical protein HMPREF3229_01823 [Peptoniphilus harei]
MQDFFIGILKYLKIFILGITCFIFFLRYFYENIFYLLKGYLVSNSFLYFEFS